MVRLTEKLFEKVMAYWEMGIEWSRDRRRYVTLKGQDVTPTNSLGFSISKTAGDAI